MFSALRFEWHGYSVLFVLGLVGIAWLFFDNSLFVSRVAQCLRREEARQRVLARRQEAAEGETPRIAVSDPRLKRAFCGGCREKRKSRNCHKHEEGGRAKALPPSS